MDTVIVHGISRGSSSANFHCQCGYHLCWSARGFLRYRVLPGKCPKCGAWLDWGEAMEWEYSLKAEG